MRRNHAVNSLCFSICVRVVGLFCGMGIFCGLVCPRVIAQSQNPSTSSVDATAVLTQIGNAFSGGKPVSTITLSGNATWHSGSGQDTGTATLTATASGAAQMQLSLTKKGSWTESQSAVAYGMDCQWTGADGITHSGDVMNCLKPVVWFLPTISLQPSSLSPDIGFADLGVGPVASGSHRHLQSQAVLSDMPSKLLTQSMQASTMDMGFDPTTLLASVLTYHIHPDNGAQVSIPIEVHYSNYQKVSGVEIPFTIQRYVNGSLQLELEISSAQIN
jgi:hypothetical protein